jgi:DNA-binding response OmpR family regulator
VLTGRVAFDNRILGLRLGADHYLTKPIKFPELAAHIEALDRRVGPQEPASGAKQVDAESQRAPAGTDGHGHRR